MDADWSKVVIEWAPADAEIYGYRTVQQQRSMMWIVGSRADACSTTTTCARPARRCARCCCRTPPQKWGVDAATLQHRAERRGQSGQRSAADLRRDRGLRHGALAAAGGRPRRSSRRKKDWRLIGKGVPRRDTPAKVNGTAHYGIDVQLPGMVYATHAALAGA